MGTLRVEYRAFWVLGDTNVSEVALVELPALLVVLVHNDVVFAASGQINDDVDHRQPNPE
jgi:hypothetical protein